MAEAGAEFGAGSGADAGTMTGRCRCGAISYTASGKPAHHALCHCEACRRSAGAYVVGWALFPREAVAVAGTPVDYESSPGTIRQFCGTCGTGMFYICESVFPGQVDIQSATLDDPGTLPAQARIQLDDAPGWLSSYGELPGFGRYPS